VSASSATWLFRICPARLRFQNADRLRYCCSTRSGELSLVQEGPDALWRLFFGGAKGGGVYGSTRTRGGGPVVKDGAHAEGTFRR